MYPGAVDVWARNFEYVAQLFDYGSAIRKVMYATNAVESVHSSFRKVTKQGACPNEKNLHTFLDIPDNPLFLLTQVRTNYATRHQNDGL